MTLDELNKSFGIPDSLTFETHASGLICGRVSSVRCSGRFFLLGAHVTEFKPHGQDEVLFVSKESFFEVGKPIRGGVPICFPWFGANASAPSAPAHGLARTVVWEISATSLIEGVLKVQLTQKFDDFVLRYEIDFGDALELSMTVTNASPSAASCELALHSYFAVQDSSKIVIKGLEDTAFIDQLSGETQLAEKQPITFSAETDRIYQSQEALQTPIEIVDPLRQRSIQLRPSNSRSTVVWNPWIDKSKRMPDFGDEEYHTMCCVETANIRNNAIELAANATATTSVRISVKK